MRHSKFKVGDKVRAVKGYSRDPYSSLQLIVGETYTVSKIVSMASSEPGVYLSEFPDSGWMPDSYFEPTETIWDTLKDTVSNEVYDMIAQKHDGPARLEDTWTITVVTPRNKFTVESAVQNGIETALRNVGYDQITTTIEKSQREVSK